MPFFLKLTAIGSKNKAPAGRHLCRNAVPPGCKPQRGDIYVPLKIVQSLVILLEINAITQEHNLG